MPTRIDSRWSDTAEQPVTPTAGRARIRLIAFWASTVVIVGELLAGAAWNLMPLDWIRAQLDHLGYPDYFAVILGVAQVAAAIAIAVPGLAVLKEWAYAGVFMLWAGAVASHLALGDGPVSWGPPMVYLMFAVASWALRPDDRRVPVRGRPSSPRAWAASIGLVVVVAAASVVTLPVADDITREWPAQRGWVEPAGRDM